MARAPFIIFHFRVKNISQAVAQQIKRDDNEHDR